MPVVVALSSRLSFPLRFLLRFLLRSLLVVPLFLYTLSTTALPLAQYQHRAFTAADGVPDEISAVSQDEDGMLWIAAAAGIFTFDGQRFSRYPVDFEAGPRTAYFLRADPRGGVWIGWTGGGVTLIRAGTARHFTAASGIPAGTVWGFDFDRTGGTWAAGMHGVARFDGQHWRRMGPADGFNADDAAAVSVDNDGNVGVFTDEGLFILRKNARRFDAPLGKTTTRQPLAMGPAGHMYFMNPTGIRRIASLQRYEQADHPYLYREKGDATGSYLADRAGGLWFDSDRGLHHLARPDSVQAVDGALRPDTETMTQAQGLSGKMVFGIFEDRRGNVWVATDGGLDRFRPTALTDAGRQTGATYVTASVFAAGPDGGVWVRTTFPRGAWLRLDADGNVVQRYDGVFPGTAVRDGDGLLAIDASRRVVALHRGTRHPSGMALPDERLDAMERDAAGRIWVATAGGQVLRSDGGAWTPVPDLPAGRVVSIQADGDAIWLGYLDNRLVRYDNGRTALYGAAQGLSTGTVSGVVRSGSATWVTGARGLNVLRDGRFTAVAGPPGMFDDLARGLMDAHGGLWLTGRAGLMYLSATQLAECLAGCAAPVRPMLFDEADGLKGRSAALGDGHIARDALGRIWVATGTGVYRIDGSAGRMTAPAPHTLVSSATAAGQRYPGNARLALKPGTHDLQVDYTAPVPDTPERMRFRYRLAGYDRQWQEAGTRRQAFYTGLAPGRYQFEVMAAEGNGPWSVQPARLDVDIAPAWYQTWWFRTTAAITLAAALVLLYRGRVQRLTRRVREQEETRQGERERIARELHDTVLQTNFALLLQVRAVAATAAGSPVGAQLKGIVSQAQVSLDDGRARIAGLRAQQDADTGLTATLCREAGAILEGSAVTLACTSHGTPWPLRAAVAAECCAIVAEAVSNVRKHAQASMLRIDVRYRWWACTVTIADNGCGIPIKHIDGRIGHWGLTGMRERAALIKGRLGIDTGPAGTTLTLRIMRGWRIRKRGAS